MRSEVSAKCGIVSSGLRSFRKVLYSPHVSVHKKAKIIRTYLMSAGSYNCGTWPKLDIVPARRFHHSIMNAYRHAVNHLYYLASEPSEVLNDDDLLFDFSLPSPESIIHASRLQLFSRIVLEKPHLLLSILDSINTHEYGWCAAVLQSFIPLSMVMHLPLPLTPVTTGFAYDTIAA